MTALLMMLFAVFGGSLGLPALYEVKKAGETGIVKGRYGTYDRRDDPGHFWISGLLLTITGVLFTAIFLIALVAAIAAMLGYFA